MKKILNILLGVLMAITVVMMEHAIFTGGSEAAISANLVWGLRADGAGYLLGDLLCRFTA